MDPHLRALAAKQADVVARWQLRDAGWSRDKIDRQTEPDVLTRVLDSYGDLESVLSSDGVLEVQNGQLRLPGLGFVWLAEP